jgi:hypothetical protein
LALSASVDIVGILDQQEFAMTEKLPCKNCESLILPSTFERTGGLCMPCKNGVQKKEKIVPIISVVVDGVDTTVIRLEALASDVLDLLEKTRHVGDSKHANFYEIEAQKALVRHSIRYAINFRLHDDHWGRTGWVMLALFEMCKAKITNIEEEGIEFLQVEKADWRQGTDPLGSCGGFQYSYKSKLIFKINTWRS